MTRSATYVVRSAGLSRAGPVMLEIRLTAGFGVGAECSLADDDVVAVRVVDARHALAPGLVGRLLGDRPARRSDGLDDGVAVGGWFGEAGRPPRTALQAEVDRLSSILGRELVAEISIM